MMISREIVRSLSLNRWLMPVLATLSRTNGVRFSALARQLGITHSVLEKTIRIVQHNGWVEHNPGHGHPLRPEYILTPAGVPLAHWCEQVVEQRNALGLKPGELNRWSLPILIHIGHGWTRFAILQQELAPITPRALSLSLKQMMSINLIQRRLEDGFPPHPLYSLTTRGLRLLKAMNLPE